MRNMVYKKHLKEDRGKIQMAPMVDIVFQLLIFFLVASEVKPTEAEFKTNLPGGTGPKDATVDKLEEYRIFLKNADREGNTVEVSLNGKPLFGNPFETLEERLANVPNKDNMILIIDGEPTVKLRFITRALDSAVAAQVPRITFGNPQPGVRRP